jgi:thiol-disulfide isomerase/thioredoxin
VASRSTLREEVKGIGLVFFFTTRCPYCQQSWPYVAQLAAELAGDTVGILGVALDDGAGHDELVATVPLQRVVAPEDVQSAVRIGLPTVPTMLLVGADDTIRGVWRGAVTETLAEEIWLATQQLLSRPR